MKKRSITIALVLWMICILCVGTVYSKYLESVELPGFNVSVDGTNIPQSLVIDTAPAKTVYKLGDAFDPTNMVVSVNYTDGTSATITGYTVIDGDSLTAGQTSVTISYTENGVTKTATQAIVIDMCYYSSLNLAVTDVNNGTIGTNADVANVADAVVGVYTKDDGSIHVVLLKDNIEAARLKPAADMTIDLAGHTLSTNDTVAIHVTGGNVVLDGKTEGSTIELSRTNTNGNLIQVVGGTLTIDGGTYINNSEGTANNSGCIVLASSNTSNINNATIISTSSTVQMRGIVVNSGATANISNCDISALSNDGIAIGIYCNGTATISDCDISATSNNEDSYGIYCKNTIVVSNSEIKAYSNYSAGYESIAYGIVSNGTLTINDCHVMSVHSGVANSGTLYVNGGTYEGYGHGGFYFGGAGTTSYVRNATIRECDMPEGYTDLGAETNRSGFYIGGNSESNNITVYMDNCDIQGSVQPIVLRGTSGEQNNSLHISNSRINLDSTAGIRIDNETHKLYIGTGNNFTANNTTRPSAVVVTNAVYTYENISAGATVSGDSSP